LRVENPGLKNGTVFPPLDSEPWTLDFPLCFHPSCSIVQELEGDLIALLADKNTLTRFPDMVTAHVHAVITAVKHLTTFLTSTNGAHKGIF